MLKCYYMKYYEVKYIIKNVTSCHTAILASNIKLTLLLFTEVMKMEMATLREPAKSSIPRVLRNSLSPMVLRNSLSPMTLRKSPSHGNNSMGKLHE